METTEIVKVKQKYQIVLPDSDGRSGRKDFQ